VAAALPAEAVAAALKIVVAAVAVERFDENLMAKENRRKEIALERCVDGGIGAGYRQVLHQKGKIDYHDQENYHPKSEMGDKEKVRNKD